MIPNRSNRKPNQFASDTVNRFADSCHPGRTTPDLSDRSITGRPCTDLQTYLDLAGVMFIEIGADQQVKRINKKGSEILGYAEHEIVGTNWFDNYIPEDQRKETHLIFQQLLTDASRLHESAEGVVLTREGEHRIIEWHNTVLKDFSGRVQGTLSSGLDVTKRKTYEEALQRELCVNSALTRLSNALISTPDDLHMFATLVLKAGLTLTDSPHGYVSMIDTKTGDNVALAYTDLKSAADGPHENPLVFTRDPEGRYDDFWGHSINTRTTLLTNDRLGDFAVGETIQGPAAVHPNVSPVR